MTVAALPRPQHVPVVLLHALRCIAASREGAKMALVHCGSDHGPARRNPQQRETSTNHRQVNADTHDNGPTDGEHRGCLWACFGGDHKDQEEGPKDFSKRK
ncbi:hypothetical protein DAI22_09g043100 [Oryza sativa Japonica Group]|nr:hypothetical protein DAI22_09g043100 [Oryza sativa Japonica Group]